MYIIYWVYQPKIGLKIHNYSVYYKKQWKNYWKKLVSVTVSYKVTDKVTRRGTKIPPVVATPTLVSEEGSSYDEHESQLLRLQLS